MTLSDAYKNKNLEGLCGDYAGNFLDRSTKAVIGQKPNSLQLAQIANQFSNSGCDNPIASETNACQVNDYIGMIIGTEGCAFNDISHVPKK